MPDLQLTVSNQISSAAAQTTLTLQEAIVNMKASGMAESAIRQSLLSDLNIGGPLFGGFKSKLRNTVKDGIEFSSNGSANGKFVSAGVERFQWISVGDGKVCPDCEEKHGETGKMEYFELIGLPGSGFSLCGSHCRCKLVPASYKGENLDRPLVKGDKSKKAEFLKTQSRIENQILKDSKNKKEIGAFYDKNGKVLFRKVGTKHKVNFYKDEIGDLDFSKSILTHNHPNSASFSIDDIVFASKIGIKEIRAIAPESKLGSVVFRLKPKKGESWPSVDLLKHEFGWLRKKNKSSTVIKKWMLDNPKWSRQIDAVMLERRSFMDKYKNKEIALSEYGVLFKKSKRKWNKIAREATDDYLFSIGADYAKMQKELADRLGLSMSWENI